jgi:hypothetical protein
MRLKSVFLLSSLITTIGCFASAPPPVVEPQPVTTQPPAPPPSDPQPEPQPQPKGNYGITADKSADVPYTPPAPKLVSPVPPQQPPQPAKNYLDDLTFEELYSWKIAGNTPMAAWSPDRSQLAIYSDYTQVEGKPNNGKKYVEVFDLKTGKITKTGTITASAYEPVWLDNSTLIFMCTKERCGKGKDGAYTYKLGDKSQKQIFTQKVGMYLSLFSGVDGSAYIYSQEYPPYSGTGPYPQAITKWYQWDPKSKKTSAREDIDVKSYEPPKGTWINNEYCSSYSERLSSNSQNGKLMLFDNKTRQSRLFKEVSPISFYPGDENGMPPCFSRTSEQMLYFYYDAATKSAKATLVQISGYPAQ